MPTSRVYVRYRDGSKATSVRVVLGFSGGMTKPAFTNSSGEATVEHSSTGRATIYVSGKDCGTMSTPGTATVTVS